MNTVIIAVVVLGVLGAVFGLILAFASKVFHVEKDPREEAIAGVLPGANCGGCGFPGCGGYASAVVAGSAPVNACAAGGAEVAKKIAAIMGTDAGATVRMVALVHCTGTGRDRNLYQYEGVQDCLAASRLPGGGPLACKFGCLAFGSCVKVCDFGALSVKDGRADVDPEKCAACKKCMDVCPRGLISLVPYGSNIRVTCASRDKGVDTRAVCEKGCIGCTLCVKACPSGAIAVENNLAAVIDYDKCISCGACVEKCPRKLIHLRNGVVQAAAAESAPTA